LARTGQKLTKAPEVEKIVWHDAVAHVGWAHSEQEYKPAVCTSVGLVVNETKSHLTVCGTWGGEGNTLETNARITIPKDWIMARKKIKL
jgi:hypothetical protein